MKRSNPKYLVTFEGVSESRGVGVADMGGFPEEHHLTADTLEELGDRLWWMAAPVRPLARDDRKDRKLMLYGVTEINQDEMWQAIKKYEKRQEARRKDDIRDKIAESQDELGDT